MTRTRSAQLLLRCTPGERERMRTLAAASGLPEQEWALRQLLGDEVEEVPERASRRWSIDLAAARSLARRLAPGDRLAYAELGTLGPALAEVLQAQGLDLREVEGGAEVVRLP